MIDTHGSDRCGRSRTGIRRPEPARERFFAASGLFIWLAASRAPALLCAILLILSAPFVACAEEKIVPPAAADKSPIPTRTIRIQVVDSLTTKPIEGVVIEAERWSQPKQYEVDAVATTDADGRATLTRLDEIDYLFEVYAARPLPYIPHSQTAGPQAKELLIKLAPACELTLRAIDDETGQPIADVLFGRERIWGEYWLQDIVPDTLELYATAGIPIRRTNIRAWLLLSRERHEKAFRNPPKVVTGPDGRYRCLVDHATWSYSVAKFPPGYNSVVPIRGLQETELETPPGKKVEYTFRLRKTKPAGTAATKPKSAAPVVESPSTPAAAPADKPDSKR